MLETQQSAAPFQTHDESGTGTSTVRLVIRARILSDSPPPTIERGHRTKPIALAVIALLVVVAIVLAVVRNGSNSKEPQSATSSVAAPVVVKAETPEPSPPAKASMPDPNTVVNEVLPTVSRASLQTVRGTIKVIIRVAVNQDGKVQAATSHIPGPSRYFERVSLQAAKKWTFAPTNATEPRTFLVHFDFTHGGVTGGADRLDQGK